MTPEEFAARAGAAVEGVEPGAASYAWLTRNLARRAARRRVWWAASATAAVALAGVAVAVVPGDGGAPGDVTATGSASPSPSPTPSDSPSETPSGTPSPTASPSPTAVAGAEPSWQDEDPRRADVDGDGTRDVVTIVEEGSRTDGDTWRWGIRVALSSGGTTTFWDDCCTNEGQELGPFADLDGDGRAELSGSPGGTAYSAGWYLVTYTGGRLVRVTGPDLVTGLDNGREVGWGCAERGGLVMTSAAFQGTTGTRVYYRLDGTRLVETARVDDTWGNGVGRPREYDEAFSCS